jgi:hypothetical protein
MKRCCTENPDIRHQISPILWPPSLSSTSLSSPPSKSTLFWMLTLHSSRNLSHPSQSEPCSWHFFAEPVSSQPIRSSRNLSRPNQSEPCSCHIFTEPLSSQPIRAMFLAYLHGTSFISTNLGQVGDALVKTLSSQLRRAVLLSCITKSSRNVSELSHPMCVQYRVDGRLSSVSNNPIMYRIWAKWTGTDPLPTNNFVPVL